MLCCLATLCEYALLLVTQDVSLFVVLYSLMYLLHQWPLAGAVDPMLLGAWLHAVTLTYPQQPCQRQRITKKHNDDK